jgi:stage IV sporulation protein FB
MAWEDRPHYRDRSGASTNPLRWLVGGSVPVANVFGVRIRAHSSLIIFIAAMVLLDWEDKRYTFSVRAFSMGIWVLMVVAHELGHCLMARHLGGQGDEALLWPAGGLAPAEPPHRAGATFVTALAGPVVNLALCIGGAMGVYALTPTAGLHLAGGMVGAGAGHVLVSPNPFHGPSPDFVWKWSDPAFYCWWVFLINYRLLLLNLLPIFPLDGGRLLQSTLWPIVGHFRSQLIETTAGMAGAVAMGLVSLAMSDYFLAACMMFCCYESYQSRLLLHESVSEDWKDSFDFGSSLFTEERPKRKRLSRRVIRKARKISQAEKAARDRIDAILAKVSAGGMTSLTWIERRTLRKTTLQQQRRETEMSRFQ